MNRVIKRRGRFALVHYEEGFLWILRVQAGEHWYWHPGTRQWTGHPDPSSTPEAATLGLDPDAPQPPARFIITTPACPPLRGPSRWSGRVGENRFRKGRAVAVRPLLPAGNRGLTPTARPFVPTGARIRTGRLPAPLSFGGVQQ
jgi:hypothetical protein